jgi:S-adenosyl methyltransferase
LAGRTLDFGKPVALMLLAVLRFILDEEEPYGLVSHLVETLPSGSYLVTSHPTDDFNPNRGESMKVYNERVAERAVVRDKTATERFFDGLDLLEPGVVPVAKWRPDSDLTATRPSSMWCGALVNVVRRGTQAVITRLSFTQVSREVWSASCRLGLGRQWVSVSDGSPSSQTGVMRHSARTSG